MKVSPIPASNNTPGEAISTSGTSGISQDRKEAAKAAYLGETIVTESDTYTDPQVRKAKETMRKIKMKTNVSTDRFNPLDIPQDVQVAQDATQEAAPTDQVVFLPDQVVDKAEVAEDTKPLSPQFAALRKQQRALQIREKELAEREKALEATTGSTPDTSDALSRLKADPLSVLQEAGVTYDQLTEAILSNSQELSPAVKQLQSELKAVKAALDEQNKSLQNRDTEQEQQVLADIKREAVKLSAVDDYEMVRITNSVDDVVRLIHRTWKETGEVLDTSEAMALVEEELVNESLKYARVKKVQNKLATPETPSANQPQKQMRTLTNRDSARPTLSPRERALAAFYGTLKK